MLLTSAPPATSQRIQSLRSLLQASDLQGLWVLSGDEHLNEYLPEVRKRREWLTGFSGSAGNALVTLTQNWLAIDSRYYEQAETQTHPEEFTLVKLAPGKPTLEDQLAELGSGFRLGVDPFTLSVAAYRDLSQHCEEVGITLVPTSVNSIDQARSSLESDWQTGYADQPVVLLPDQITGSNIAAKLRQVRAEMKKHRIQLLPLTKLDQIAWLLNLRGSDIPYNPLMIAYGLVSLDRVIVFTQIQRLSSDVKQSLGSVGVEIEEYEAYPEALKYSAQDQVVGIDTKHTTQGTLTLLNGSKTRDVDNLIELLKARKNPVELAQMRQANLKASRAKIRTLAWIDAQIAQGHSISEAQVAQQIEAHYAAEPDWRGLSFNTIAATGSNSSIVHYGTPDPDRTLEPGRLLLLDSGAQFWGGTTDDTRTVIIGEPDPLQKQRYTEVLKAHIQCASQRFPLNTPGVHLDGITRSSMWQAGLDFGHGTGHGVGAFLNVHEGPNGIHRKATTVLEVGMINSIEPGFYEPGWGGIRIENLVEVMAIPDQAGWLQFQPLTWIPFDRRLIEDSLLSSAQKEWIRVYHQQVYQLHHEHLDPEEASWLTKACGVLTTL